VALARKHRFSPTSCGRDPAYPGNRQTADLHLRQLICRALASAAWNVRAAAALLAGAGGAALEDKAAGRIRVFLDNLRARLSAEGHDQLQSALAEEWKGSTPLVLAVLEAERAGKITVETT
jgi:hypothetical protein